MKTGSYAPLWTQPGAHAPPWVEHVSYAQCSANDGMPQRLHEPVSPQGSMPHQARERTLSSEGALAPPAKWHAPVWCPATQGCWAGAQGSMWFRGRYHVAVAEPTPSGGGFPSLWHRCAAMGVVGTYAYVFPYECIVLGPLCGCGWTPAHLNMAARGRWGWTRCAPYHSTPPIQLPFNDTWLKR